MKQIFIFLAWGILLLSAAIPARAQGGFDEFGYNRDARVFNGTCVDWGRGKYGWTEAEARTWCGVYADDKIIMKWNEAWDFCNEHGNDDPSYCAGAWINNEWNGKKNGSESVWHYKIVWVGSAAQNSPYWHEGGYQIWDNYEVIMDQGVDPNYKPTHFWIAHGIPSGYGAK